MVTTSLNGIGEWLTRMFPSLDLPATAVPCRVRHIANLSEATLEVKPKIFEKALEELKKLQYGAKLKACSLEGITSLPDGDDLFSHLDDSETLALTSSEHGTGATEIVFFQESDAQRICDACKDLRPECRDNLLRFETEGFALRSRVVGLKAIHDLVGCRVHYCRMMHWLLG